MRELTITLRPCRCRSRPATPFVRPSRRTATTQPGASQLGQLGASVPYSASRRIHLGQQSDELGARELYSTCAPGSITSKEQCARGAATLPQVPALAPARGAAVGGSSKPRPPPIVPSYPRRL